MRMYKKLPTFLVALLMFQPIPTARAIDIPQTFTFTGAGYGHGVGMSQIGARARAMAGESASAILKYYFKGVEIAPIVDTATIRVNIGHLLKSATFSTSSIGTTLQIYDSETLLTTVPNKTKFTFSIAPDLKTIQGYNSSLITIRWVVEIHQSLISTLVRPRRGTGTVSSKLKSLKAH